MAAAALTALLLAAGCKPIVRPAPFAGARDRVTDDSLLGPFDGQIVDATTGEPIREAVVVGVWSYDKGDGFIGPWGSETVLVSTDEAGRYRIGSPRVAVRGSSLRMVAFHLVAYRRGYEAYRSDALVGGGARHDFTVRHNRVELRKWRDSDSHADHLIFLAPPPEVAKVSRWERAQANLELYRRLGGERAVKLPPVGGTKAPPDGEPSVAQWLDARALLPPSEARLRTGDTEAFEVKDLADLERTAYYHGVHLQAAGRAEEWDITYRVWLDPPDGLDPVVETFGATLPDVPMSSEVMPETWVLDGAALRAVAFIDRKRKAGVLLTCGAQQCGDLDTAIILAKFIAGRLEMLTSVPAGEAAKPIPDAAKPEPETPETPETPEPEPEPEPEPAPKTAEDVEPETEPAPEDRR